MGTEGQKSWDELGALLASDRPEELLRFLRDLPSEEVVRAISRLEEAQRTLLFSMLSPADAAGLVEQIPDVQAVDLMEDLAPAAAAAILDELPSDEQADLIGDLDAGDAEAILKAMAPDEAADARALSAYDDDVAGGLMVTEYLSYPLDFTVEQVCRDLQANADTYRDYQVQYAFVVDDERRLVGVLRLRDLLLARASSPIRELMQPEAVTVSDMAGLDDLRHFFERTSFFGAPVVDAEARLVGIVKRSSVLEATTERAESDYLKTQGIVGGEELRTMPLFRRSRRRLSWLSINIVLNIIAAGVIAAYQETLQAVIALAVFLPISSDMSGCSGNQAVAVSMRELTMGLVTPHEVLRVWMQEVKVGALNGMVLGALVGGLAWLWKGNVVLGLVVGGALAANTVIAVSIGGVVPLALRGLKLDPALASGPILTTVTDMCGFFLVLSIASAVLPRLSGM